jgi:hypothetical protein
MGGATVNGLGAIIYRSMGLTTDGSSAIVWSPQRRTAMANINDHIDAFISCNSLNNARKLVNHVRRHPMVMCLLTEDHAGQVRNAERMIDTEASRLNGRN